MNSCFASENCAAIKFHLNDIETAITKGSIRSQSSETWRERKRGSMNRNVKCNNKCEWSSKQKKNHFAYFSAEIFIIFLAHPVVSCLWLITFYDDIWVRAAAQPSWLVFIFLLLDSFFLLRFNAKYQKKGTLIKN